MALVQSVSNGPDAGRLSAYDQSTDVLWDSSGRYRWEGPPDFHTQAIENGW